MRPVCLAILLSLALAMDHVLAATIAGPVTNPATGHSHYLLSYNTWTASENEAIALGGHLVTINDAAENQWVYDSFIPIARLHNSPGANGNVVLWIGLSDAETEGVFTWASGEPVSYLHWDVTQPNNNSNQDYVHMYGPIPVFPATQHPGFWNDYADEAYSGDPFRGHFGVVEVVPEPSSLALVALGTFGSLLFRRRQ
jgi:hypothetical protein